VTGQQPSGMKTPGELAEDVIRLMGDADSNTAHTAMRIAELLLTHRDHAQLDFDRQMLTGQS
jgi:hypothetical protein